MVDEAKPGEVLEPWRQEGIVPYGDDAGRVAVFLDFENLVLGAGQGLPGHDEPIPAKALAWLCRGFGNASIRRAYADWTKVTFGRYQEALATNGVDLIQIGRFGMQHKNAADIRMAVDAMETLIAHPDVGVFILVTGDSDYSPLVARLREHGKHVVGVGTEPNASARLVSVCSRYKFWGTLVAEVDPSARATAQATFDIADAEALLVRAFERTSTDTPTAGAVKNAMRALDPAFDENNYGCSRFREFLARLAHRVRTAGQSGSDITIALVNDADTANAAERV
ncbi:MAG: NYN domain-containing protein [Actinomycetota bacterium]|nr:NYN domain-containing protein [Actinomycetota bacterium]